MFLELRDKLNRKYEEEYEKLVVDCEKMLIETQERKDKWEDYFQTIGLKFKLACQLTEDWDSDFYLKYEECELQNLNKMLGSGVGKEEYEESYLNHAHSVKQFGKEMGQVATVFASMIQPLYHRAVEGQHFDLVWTGSILMELYRADRDAEVWKNLISKSLLREDQDISQYQQLKSFTPEYRANLDIVENADLNDLRYLYQYMNHVGGNEIETAKFLNAYPQEKIDKLAETIVEAYIRGFVLSDKDYKTKSTASIYYNMGQERIIRSMIPMLRKKGLEAIISNANSTKLNPQYNYDHRYDRVVYLSEEFMDKVTKTFKVSSELNKDVLKAYSGTIYFDRFGEELFSPIPKPECLKPSKEHQVIMQKMSMKFSQISQIYMPRDESSFCIIGFPVPEIGEKFTEIFEGTADINMLSSEKWETIQQHIIDVLDQADYVEVKGKGKNKTDIQVKMQHLKDPAKQTNFCNCTADVNIPVGEVFTSPQLEGTNGILHVTDIFLEDLNYLDLTLTFKDGFAVDYTCSNYDDAEKNRQYVHENLFLPHEKLPLGEFAIGTNTPAYLLAKKFNILPQMPILIIEKMGPHFAIGDTCYSWEEDRAVYNPDGKEIMSRDNSVSALRKTDMSKAYTNKHTDITLAYEELGNITVVGYDGKRTDIIRDGRFVVPGTEVLNEPLEELDKA